MKSEFESLASMTAIHAALTPERVAVGFIQSGQDETLTCRGLAARARASAERLSAHVAPGDRVVLALRPSLQTVVAFFACQYAGVVPILVAPPFASQVRISERVQGIARAARARVALVDDSATAGRLDFMPTLELSHILAEGEAIAPLVPASPIAFLQYTSGSTREPKGVIVTQRSVLANLGVIEEAFAHDTNCLTVNWLPPHHDMGLVGAMLQPMYTGFPSYLMTPRSFLASPFEWLRAITRLRATTAGAPSFGFELCVARVTDAQLAELDLSSLRVLFCGAEPIRVDALEWFARKFARAQLDPKAIYPCYGLAESTLFVTGVKVGSGLTSHVVADQAPAQGDAVAMRLPKRLASCGHPRGDTEIRIVDAERCVEVAEGEVGEIWVRGASVAAGYFECPEDTKEVFGAHLTNGEGPFMRTGDLGVLSAGELSVVGRRKDVLIVDGVKYVAHDIEATCRLAGAGRISGALATELADGDGVSGIALWIGVEPAVARKTPVVELAEAVRRTVASAHGVSVPEVAVVSAKALLRTSSGKLERAATLLGLRNDPSLVLAKYTARAGWKRACDVWRLVSIPRAQAKTRLVVLGAAGVGASSYAGLARALPPEVELVAIQYPGRESRRHEPPLTRIEPMVAELSSALVQWGSQPYHLLGHSMGGRIAIMLTRRMTELGMPPKSLVLAACSEPGTVPDAARLSYAMSPADFDAYIDSFSVMPAPVRAANGAVREALVSLLRADFELHDTAADTVKGSTLEVPGLLLVGSHDPVVREPNLRGWSAYFAKPPLVATVEGGHFFMQDAPLSAASALLEFLPGHHASARTRSVEGASVS